MKEMGKMKAYIMWEIRQTIRFFIRMWRTRKQRDQARVSVHANARWRCDDPAMPDPMTCNKCYLAVHGNDE